MANMDHCYRDNFKPFPHTRGVILSHIFSTRFQKGSDHNAVNTWTFMVMERNRYYRTCKCHSSYCSVQTAQRRIQNWDYMHYSYSDYTDLHYRYDSMHSGSDAHISNRIFHEIPTQPANKKSRLKWKNFENFIQVEN